MSRFIFLVYLVTFSVNSYAFNPGTPEQMEQRAMEACVNNWEEYQDSNSRYFKFYEELMKDIELVGQASLCHRTIRPVQIFYNKRVQVLVDYIKCGHQLEGHLSLRCRAGMDTPNVVLDEETVDQSAQ